MTPQVLEKGFSNKSLLDSCISKSKLHTDLHAKAPLVMTVVDHFPSSCGLISQLHQG